MIFESNQRGLPPLRTGWAMENLKIDPSLRSVYIEAVLESFPVMLLEKGEASVFIDIHTLLESSDTLAFLLQLNSESPSKHFEKMTVNEGTRTVRVNEEPSRNFDDVKGNRGRPLHSVRYPYLVESVLEFLMSVGWQADKRRRTNTATPVGETIPEIRQYLATKFPQMDISESGIRYLFRAPRAPRKNAQSRNYYHHVIDAGIPRKDNSGSEGNVDSQIDCAQVRFKAEFGAYFSSSVSRWSLDNKAKVKVGVMAVSRYHKLESYFLNGDEPLHADHDFPLPGYLIEPAGYLLLGSQLPEV